MLLGLGVAVTLIGVMAYVSTMRKAELRNKPRVVAGKNVVVNMENDLLKKSNLLDAQNNAKTAEEKLKEAQAKIAELEKQQNTSKDQNGPAKPPVTGGVATSTVSGVKARNAVSVPLPPPPVPTPQRVAVPPPPPPMPAGGHNSGVTAANPLPVAQASKGDEIGGISQTTAPERKDEKVDKKKDEKRSVYLPVSFMEATLLSGLDAPTSSAAEGRPVPMLIRVRAPAVLPNDVKADLQGCLVVADAKGNLATERAEPILVNLSCLDRKGRAVIDEKITGYVADEDGKAGLRGQVVTKMGAMIVRSLVAGIFGGAGNALQSTVTTTSLTGLGGAVQSIQPKDIGMAAAGSGLSSAFKDIQKFYLDLAHQTMPVVSIGAGRRITLVITQGTMLNIKKLKEK